MLGRLRNSFAEIDLSALEQNFLALSKAMGGTPRQLAPMVKADAYGHGDIQVARVCEKLGSRFLGVALVEEGIRLRLAGIQSSILVFSHFDSVAAEAIVRYRLTPVLSQLDQIERMTAAAGEGAGYHVHAKFNTGMHRLGFEPEQAREVAALFSKSTALKLEGACTHFASAEDFSDGQGETLKQIGIFSQITSEIKKSVQSSLLFHTHNSAAIIGQVTPKYDFARPGIALYGSLPKLNGPSSFEVNPVMTIKSFVGFIHKVKKGAKVSYGGTWVAPKDSVIAVIPIGYADGIPRSLSNKGRVLIRGEFCSVTGIVCMDYILADVTELVSKNVGPVIGDETVILGKQGQNRITPEDLAHGAGTISYEILTGIQARIPRVYLH